MILSEGEMNFEDLMKDIKKCKEIIEVEEGIRKDISFIEMIKILLVKVGEEVSDEKTKFNSIFFKEDTIKKFNNLLNELNSKHSIFEGVVKTNVKSGTNLLRIINLLENWNFRSIDKDVSGAIYQIFLKANLRGSLGQFFTPKEIVDFMIEFSEPSSKKIILDPACGSGGFLISYLNKLKEKENISSKRIMEVFKNNLWGFEIDMELSYLAKINLLLNGDGAKHILNINSLNYQEENLDNHFDLILTNPPFSFNIEEREILDKYFLGKNRKKEQIDILFLEVCFNLLKAEGVVGIVLPEGLLNLPKYQYFREFILNQSTLIGSISLPAGAFLPFGQSNSKTCILFLKRGRASENQRFFIGDAKEIGFVCGKKEYRSISKNDLRFFISNLNNSYNNLKTSADGGRFLQLDYKKITSKRLDAKYYLVNYSQDNMGGKNYTLMKLKDVAEVYQPKINPSKEPLKEFYYLEIPDISENTGTITNIRKVLGKNINGIKTSFKSNDILFSRLYPEKGRITIVPESIKEGVTSTEIYIINPKKDDLGRYSLLASLKSSIVKNQVNDLVSGSSSSRPRLHIEDLKNIKIPILKKDKQNRVEEILKKAMKNQWNSAQEYLDGFKKVIQSFGDDVDLNGLRGI